MGRVFSVALVFVLAFAGCGKTAAPAPTKEKMSTETKSMVDQFVDKARKKQAGVSELTVLLETLEARAKDLGGGHQAVVEAAKKLQAAYGKKATDVEKELDGLSQAASAL